MGHHGVRADDQVTTRHHRCHVGEVQAGVDLLLGRHEAIGEAAERELLKARALLQGDQTDPRQLGDRCERLQGQGATTKCTLHLRARIALPVDAD